jgi:hypothetical protein
VGRSYAFQEVAENRKEDEPAERTWEQLLHVLKLRLGLRSPYWSRVNW